jgi:hypothetical protein
MDISVRATGDFVGEDRSWLASQDGTQFLKNGVLALPLFTKATHYPNGVIRSGTWVVKATSGTHAGKYGPFDAAATDGRQTAANAFPLFNTTSVDPKSSAVYVGCPLQRRGYIREANRPPTSGVTSGLKTALAGRFSFE